MDKEEDLFLRAMDTLGVKARPKPEGSKKGSGPKAPSVLDDDLDFDALMQTGRGPAKLMKDTKPRATSGTVHDASIAVATNEPGLVASRRPDPRDYAATHEEIALFEAALSDGLGGSVESGVQLSGKADRRRPASSDLFDRCIKKGEVEPEAVLDLHHRQRDDAVRRLKLFLEEAVSERWRIVAIVCGRGLHSANGQPVLKPLIGSLLSGDLRTFVRRYAEAPRALGGAGTWIAEVRLEAHD